MTPLISIITICRNDLAGLQRTYKSVSLQDRSVFEWIVVDGASTDGTVDFLKSLTPGIACWSSEPDSGIYDAMNKGIRRSNGSHCIFLNSGDELAELETLASLTQHMTASNDLIYGDAIEVFANCEAYKEAFPARRYWYSMFTHHQAMFYRREILGGGYDTTFRLAADWALTSSLLMKGATTLYVARPICRFQRGGSSDKTTLRAIADEELWRMYREVIGHRLHTAVALYTLKRAANILRLSAKPVYRQLRMRPVSTIKRGMD